MGARSVWDHPTLCSPLMSVVSNTSPCGTRRAGSSKVEAAVVASAVAGASRSAAAGDCMLVPRGTGRRLVRLLRCSASSTAARTGDGRPLNACARLVHLAGGCRTPGNPRLPVVSGIVSRTVDQARYARILAREATGCWRFVRRCDLPRRWGGTALHEEAMPLPGCVSVVNRFWTGLASTCADGRARDTTRPRLLRIVAP